MLFLVDTALRTELPVAGPLEEEALLATPLRTSDVLPHLPGICAHLRTRAVYVHRQIYTNPEYPVVTFIRVHYSRGGALKMDQKRP